MPPRQPPKRKAWSQPLADFVVPVMSPVLAKNGFGEADIILNWEEIAGARLAAVCEPIKIQWPGRAPKASPEAPVEPAALVVRVEGAFALELQHSAPVLIERVNAHLGWRCIGRIALRQGPLERRAAVNVKRPPPDAESLRLATESVQGIDDEALREALLKLGGEVFSDAASKRKSP